MNTTTSDIKSIPANPALMRAMQELRRSSAASKHRNRKKYNRSAAKRERHAW